MQRFVFIHVMKVLLFVKCVYVLYHVLEYLGKNFSFPFSLFLCSYFWISAAESWFKPTVYITAGSIGFGTCYVDSDCTEHSLFVSPPMVRQRHKEVEGRLLQEITIIMLVVLT